jgi:hypothetical protein
LIQSFTGRFIVLQVLALAAIAGLALDHKLNHMLTHEIRWFSLAVMVFGAYGVYQAWLKQWDNVNWISARLVRVGVIAMQVGIFSGALVMADMLLGGGDVMKIGGAFIKAMGVGFVVSILALTLNLWLDLHVKLLKNA